jgi:DNA polymerase III subunit beta
VICNRGALLEALVVAGNVVAARTPKPVLQCVKLAASGSELTISATDLEVAIRYVDPQVEVTEPGEVLVMADKLRDIVRESIDDTLSIESSNEMAIVKGQDATFRIYTQAGESFPPIAEFEGEGDFQVQGGLLKKLISQTIFSAAKAGTRYAYNGVLATAKAKSLVFVATDGHRLAQAKAELSAPAKGEKEGLRAIIPTKAMTMIDRLIDNPEDPVSFQIRENQVIVHTPSATLISNLVEGQFPPYEDVIPKGADRIVTAGTADFLSAVRRAALVSTEESRGIRIKLSKSGMVISSQSPIAGESTVNFPCKYDGPEFEIGFNPVYLVDALKVVDVDELTIELAAANRPGLLRGGPNFLYVIMPVNLS